MANDKENPNKKHHYFVDNDKFDTDDSTTTGALIKIRLPETKRSYSLYLEGHGNDPDQLVNDDTSVSLDKGTKHFYTVPPASFGIS
jgi:hypothetical protein